eukprot:CAMPEP_0178442024 /NCGR_PEP_ID=MMETSP0689_2-20121128/37892_1 /TAXON_ID=160604 /ORGANISM="Amphidinium massartii, Strain CS-259" /LENGTH=117 /DNA_ID=CAMNT_0020065439 /DNA_START=213 /DNA_END=566 /DNA_ORIENTATION=-
MKLQSAFLSPTAAANSAGWAYFMQALAIATEGFYHQSVPRAEKVLGSTVVFSVGMWLWLQLSALQHMRWRFRSLENAAAGSAIASHEAMPAPQQAASSPEHAKPEAQPESKEKEEKP